MENEITNIKVCMQGLKTDIKYISESLDELKVEFKGFTEQCDKKYASKWTEKIVFGMVGMIVLYFLGLILKTIELR
jgi:hypothetical protein